MATDGNNLGAKRAIKGQNEYMCEICHFTCCKKYSWERHILTSKHIQATDGNVLATIKGQKGQLYCCENCGKEYNDRTGLWRHNKKCISNAETISQNKKLSELDKDELIITLLKQIIVIIIIIIIPIHITRHLI
jgi:hypothetical protein